MRVLYWVLEVRTRGEPRHVPLAGTSENPLGWMEKKTGSQGVTEDPPLVKGTAPALVWGMGLAEEISMLIGKGVSWGGCFWGKGD